MSRFILLLLFLAGAATAQVERTAHFSVTHRGEGQPSLIEIRLEPPIGNREIYFDMESGNARRGAGVWTRRRLQAAEPGLYRLEHRFGEAGLWGFYVHYGSGLSGYDAYAKMTVTLTSGETDRTSQAFRFFPADAARLPAYAQPLGYTGFALLALVLLFTVARILGQLRRQLQGHHAL